MRVLVVGAGAIGSLVGNRLALAGHEVTLVGRASYVEAVWERGVGVEENGRRFYAPNVWAVAQLDAASMTADPPDVMLFTMKAYDTGEAAAQVAPLARRGVPILVVQNGVGGEALAAQALESEGEGPGPTILSAVITLSVEVIQPGLVQLSTSRGGIGLAPVESGSSVEGWARLFREAGFRVRVYPDYRAPKWSKLLLNMLGNGTVAILDWPPNRVFGDARLFALERAAFREALAVMEKMGVRPVGLPGYPVPLLAWAFRWLPDRLLQPVLRRIVAGGRGGKMPSLYLDLADRRQHSEVEFLNGAVVRQGERFGIPTPVNEALYTTLMGIVRGDVAWDAYRQRPERLLDVAGQSA